MKRQMKIYLLNDTSGSHAGCDAVMEVLNKFLSPYDVIGKCKTHTQKIDEFSFTNAEAIVINGEGTLHDDQDEARFLMSMIAQAQRMNIRTVLLNALYERMPDTYNNLVSKIDYISARDPSSFANFKKCGSQNVYLFPDLSLQYTLPKEPNPNERIEIALGDLHPDADISNKGVFYQLPFPSLHLNKSFSDLVRELEKTKIYITGQFHGLCAAILAGARFVPIVSNTSKIESLIKWSKLDIPVVSDMSELTSALFFAKHNRDIYKDFSEFILSKKQFNEKEMEKALYGS